MTTVASSPNRNTEHLGLTLLTKLRNASSTYLPPDSPARPLQLPSQHSLSCLHPPQTAVEKPFTFRTRVTFTTSSNTSAAARAPASSLRHSVRGNGWYKAEPQVPSQLSSQHKPDQQFSWPPLQPLTAGAPSLLSYFNSLIGWQLRAPNECSFFVSKLVPICTRELSLSPFSACICTLKIPWIHS